MAGDNDDYYAAVATAINSSEPTDDNSGVADGGDGEQALAEVAPAVEPESGEMPAGTGEGELATPPANDGNSTDDSASTEGASEEDAQRADGDDVGFLDGLSPRSKARFERLTTELREKSEQADGFQRLRGMLNEHIDSPETFATLLDFSKALKAQDWTAAQRIFQTVGNELAMRSGRALPAVDPLAEFPDLQATVGEYGMSPEQALEIARSRRLQQREQQQAVQVQREQQMNVAFVQRASTGRDRVALTLEQLEKTDPDFKAKMGMIAAQAAHIETQYQPEQWDGVVKLMYDAVRLQPLARKATNPQPLRPVAAVGKVESKPTSTYEAVMAAFL